MATAQLEPQIKAFLSQTRTYLSADEIRVLEHALAVAAAAHQGQTRKTGEAYLIHPVATATTLADYRLDTATLVAALLHDVPEDTTVTLQEIKKLFGSEVMALVDGVTKLSQVRLKKSWQDALFGQNKTTKQSHSQENFETFDRHVETLRKMFFAMSRDLRVVLIKLADRLHNMQTLSALSADKQRRIAQETIEVYAPLANRLGMGELKGQLEDLAFAYAYPEAFAELDRIVGSEITKRQQYIERIRRILLKKLAGIGIRAEAHGRAKHLYSLWRKLNRYEQNFGKIHDLVAARVIVPTIDDCYRALGLIHQLWRPLPGRIKDYIAFPKPNGYQSLHTTVFGLNGTITEIQIRTPDMHQWAEYGIAAHSAYKETGHESNRLRNVNQRSHQSPVSRKQLAWLKELARLEHTPHDPSEWRKGLKLDFFEDRIFVFTPHGDVLDLPAAATTVDFAFAVHSDLGRHCVGAKVNGKLVSLSHPLQNGDIVEILTNRKAKPKHDWLRFTKTHRARSLIRRSIHQVDQA